MQTALIFLVNIIQFLIIIRAVVSWFPSLAFRSGHLYLILIKLTDPFIGPVRKVISKIGAARSLPIDLSPLVSYIILTFIARLIRMI